MSKEDSAQPLRVVEIALPTGTEELLQSFPGYESYNSGTECLSWLKPGFGLKDAPRLWNAALQRVLRKCGLCAVQTDRQLFVKHKNGKLILALSVHVDDIKMTGLDDEIKSVPKKLV